MPGSLSTAAPSTVLPRSLYSAFNEQHVFPMRECGPYVDGRSQRAYTGSGSRKIWALTKRLTYAEWLLLEDFYVDRRGSLEPFYFYPFYSHYDATGVSTTGRFIVRFDCAITRAYSVGRQEVGLRLVQVS
jgi:hypothetical protein